jgi:hypothetical protein
MTKCYPPPPSGTASIRNAGPHRPGLVLIGWSGVFSGSSSIGGPQRTEMPLRPVGGVAAIA